jgi:stalled ribosome rescue protein Dom34
VADLHEVLYLEKVGPLGRPMWMHIMIDNATAERGIIHCYYIISQQSEREREKKKERKRERERDLRIFVKVASFICTRKRERKRERGRSR